MVPKPRASHVGHPAAERPEPLRVLPTSVPKELLRGVALHTCLAGNGMHWANSNARHMPDFAFSQEVDGLDDFLSHDWVTSRWAKLGAMLVVYNSRAACFAAFAVAIIWGVLGKFLFMPDARFDDFPLEFLVFTSPVVVAFYTVLISWQQMKRVFRKPRLVFLDKLCISQHNMSMKEKGIAGLAGFLSKSKRMVILWSPRYFTRLWCTYELGAFLRLRRLDETKSVELMPALFGAYLCILSFIMTMSFYTEIGFDAFSSAHPNDILPLVQKFFVLLTTSLGVWIYLKLLQSLAPLADQLANFSIRDSKCFCCSVDHCMPDTGEDMPCDRKFVYGTLVQWYSDNSDVDALELYDREVRSQLREFVAEQFGNGFFPLTRLFYMFICCRLCITLSWTGKDVISPNSEWLVRDPRAAAALFRFTALVDKPQTFLLGVSTILALIRLFHKACLQLWLGIQVVIIMALTEVVQQLNTVMKSNAFDLAVEAALAYQLVLVVLCLVGIIFMARKRSERSERSERRCEASEKPTADL